MSAVVSDSSPLICLCFLGHEHLLKELFQKIYVPPAVADELRRPHPPLNSIVVEDISGVLVQTPKLQRPPGPLPEGLHEGELQAMALAMELNADLLIMDEAIGRQAAQSLKIPIIGTCGILIRAKRQTLVDEVRPLLDSLRRELHFFVSQELYQHTLHLAGE